MAGRLKVRKDLAFLSTVSLMALMFSTVLVMASQVVIVVYRLVEDGNIQLALFTLTVAVVTISAVVWNGR